MFSFPYISLPTYFWVAACWHSRLAFKEGRCGSSLKHINTLKKKCKESNKKISNYKDYSFDRFKPFLLEASKEDLVDMIGKLYGKGPSGKLPSLLRLKE